MFDVFSLKLVNIKFFLDKKISESKKGIKTSEIYLIFLIVTLVLGLLLFLAGRLLTLIILDLIIDFLKKSMMQNKSVSFVHTFFYIKINLLLITHSEIYLHIACIY